MMTRISHRTCTVLASVVAFVLVTASPCFACSCTEGTDAGAFDQADAVFVGRVVDRSDPNAGGVSFSSADPILWTFEVESVQKGDVAERQAIASARSGASCGIEFVQGLEYQVFADEGKGALSANLCSGTRSTASKAAFVPDGSSDPLPEPVDVPPSQDTGVWVLTWAAAGILTASGVGLLLFRRRFR